jgi:hypothetical protein
MSRPSMTYTDPKQSRQAQQPSPPSSTTAVPILRVMRLQSPELHTPMAGSLGSESVIQTALCLPDSLGVFVGEKFTAYLGILNSNNDETNNNTTSIRRLCVSALLQTPSQRWLLPSALDPGGMDVPPHGGADAIVSHEIVEAGQHILRVEVTYADGSNTRTFRKFYRFNVTNPLTIKESVVRSGDATCYVSVAVSYASEPSVATTADSILVRDVQFDVVPGFVATRIGSGTATTKVATEQETMNAVDLLDEAGVLSKGSCFRYLFQIQASSHDAILRGIAAGDLLGKAVITWSKTMGEMGRVSSQPILCPQNKPDLPGVFGLTPLTSNFVMYNSGLSVDAAAAAAAEQSSDQRTQFGATNDLTRLLPVTIEPIDPPARMQLHQAKSVQFLVVNHALQSMNVQVQFRLPQMSLGLAVCGPSFINIGEIPPNGGSTVVTVKYLPLEAGMLRAQGCCIVDLITNQEIPQPALFHTFVESGSNEAPRLVQ